LEAVSAPEAPPRSQAGRSFARRLADHKLLALGLLAVSLSTGAFLRVWLATHDDGIFWPDEIYQSLEPAHRLVFGYGLVAWEFRAGARSWAFPGFVALVLKACSVVGLTDARSYLMVVRGVFCLIGVATAAATFRLARSQGASPLSAAAAAALFALSAPAIFYAPRAMSESAAALVVVVGLTLALHPEGRSWQLALGAALLALATMLRLQTAVFGLGLVVVLALTGRRRPALIMLAVFAAGMLLFGLVDALTWGSWFHSAITYVRFNLVEDRSASWGTASFVYYPVVLVSSMGVAGFLMLALAAFAWRRSRSLWILGVAFLVAHSLIPHKELRFVLPALPVACALAGVGLDQFTSRAPTWMSRSVAALLAVSLAFSAATFHQLTFHDLGSVPVVGPPTASAYDFGGSANRLLLVASKRSDLCGIKLESSLLEWAGGYSYLDRPVPLYRHDGPSRQSGKFNYVIARAGSVPSSEVVATDGKQVLAHLPVSRCTPDPHYSPDI
jgi:phosphatidylinositol glycan class B